MTALKSRLCSDREAVKTETKESDSCKNGTLTRSMNLLPFESETSNRKEKSKNLQDNDNFAEDLLGERLYEGVPKCAEHFDIISKVGEGTFSKVYLARWKNNPKLLFALKHVVETSAPSRVRNELICLQELGGRNNIISLRTTLRNADHTIFVLPYFAHDKFQDYMNIMTIEEVIDYFRNLLRALRWLHSHNIIHRDVKPSNFLYSRATRRYALVDFGLAMQAPGTIGLLTDQSTSGKYVTTQEKENESISSKRFQTPRGDVDGIFLQTRNSQTQRKPNNYTKNNHDLRTRRNTWHDSKKRQCPTAHEQKEICSFCSSRSDQAAPRAGTPGFRSPEVLMKLPNQTTAVDMWSVGIIFLSILSGRYPFFKVSHDMEALSQLIAIFGGKQILRESLKFGKDVHLSPSPPPEDLKDMCVRLRGNVCAQHRGKRKRSNEEMIDDSPGVLNSSHEGRQRGRAHKSKTRRRGIKDALDECTDTGGSDIPDSCNSSFDEVDCSCNCFPAMAYDLMKRCITVDPSDRISAHEALDHPFLSAEGNQHRSCSIR